MSMGSGHQFDYYRFGLIRTGAKPYYPEHSLAPRGTLVGGPDEEGRFSVNDGALALVADGIRWIGPLTVELLTALERAGYRSGTVYVPNCLEDNRFDREQLYRGIRGRNLTVPLPDASLS
ncbi:MAG: hypothetical protein GF368_02630 [Candidatus Aenigmarchaeota archaeon]|nr:hypothetical protein [Candidatus Aenigmarchaeota archaeon]